MINLRSKGAIPVAILGSDYFDPLTIDIPTVTLAGAGVKVSGNGNPVFTIEDVNGDGLIDLVVRIMAGSLELTTASVEAFLDGWTYDGLQISGSDSVTIVGN